MAEHVTKIGEQLLIVEYTYIPEQKEKYPDTEPLRSHVEIDKICVYAPGLGQTDITDIMYEVADDWLIHLETEIIEKLED